MSNMMKFAFGLAAGYAAYMAWRKLQATKTVIVDTPVIPTNQLDPMYSDTLMAGYR